MAIPYVTVSEFQEAVDVRALAELGTDTNTDGTVDSGNTILLRALVRGSSDVVRNVSVGGMYSLTDLDELAAADDWTLKGLVCDLAVMHLISRRIGGMPDSWVEKIKQANIALSDLRQGGMVFPKKADERASAGVPSVTLIQPDQRAILGFATDQPFFPPRQFITA